MRDERLKILAHLLAGLLDRLLLGSQRPVRELLSQRMQHIRASQFLLINSITTLFFTYFFSVPFVPSVRIILLI
jgi:hypothetical protein